MRVFVAVHKHRWFSLRERLPLAGRVPQGAKDKNRKWSFVVIKNLIQKAEKYV